MIPMVRNQNCCHNFYIKTVEVEKSEFWEYFYFENRDGQGKEQLWVQIESKIDKVDLSKD